jgi:hypothetical protein
MVRDFSPVAVYDMWTGERFPVRGRNVTVKLPAYEGRMLAWLPFAPARLTVQAEGKPGPGKKVRLLVRQPAQGKWPGLLPLSVDVFAPDGQRVAGYSQRAVMEEGQLAVAIPFAKNDPAGRWEVRVTDLVTRRVTSLRLEWNLE